MMLADGVEGAEFKDVKDSEKRADNPPKAPGGGSQASRGGEYPPAPDNCGGQGPGASSLAPGGLMRGFCPEAHVR